jgi:hypothetical protein
MLEPVRYQTKPTQSGIFLVLHWTEIMDAGVSMLALVSTMPMPSEAKEQKLKQNMENTNTNTSKAELSAFPF